MGAFFFFSLSLWGFERKKNEQPGLLPLSGVRRVSPHTAPPRHPSSHSRFLLQTCVTNNGNKTKAFCSDLTFPSGPQPPHRGDSNRVSLCSLCLALPLCRAGPWTTASQGGSLRGRGGHPSSLTSPGSTYRPRGDASAQAGHTPAGKESWAHYEVFPWGSYSVMTGKGEAYIKVSCPLCGLHVVNSWQTVHKVIKWPAPWTGLVLAFPELHLPP